MIDQIMVDHLTGDLSCPYCDKNPSECNNCGGTVHLVLLENATGEVLDRSGVIQLGIPLVEEVSECDGCGPDYII